MAFFILFAASTRTWIISTNFAHKRYNFTQMALKRLIALAFTTHALIGSFCMMPMASAMPAEDHAEMQNMDMMSHEDCPNCPHEEHESEKQMPCDSGHCLSAHKSEASVSSSVTIEIRTPVVSSVLLIAVPAPTLDQPSWQFIAEGPPPETGISTIVLRQ